MSWNVAQYLRFAGPRLRPALDLLAQVPADLDPTLAVDLGCGTGSATQLISARWPRAEVIGVDGSAEMLATAATQANAGARVRWQQADIGSWRAPAPVDLIYSNAALHWLPEHATLFPALIAQLAPGGVLAVQMPRNFDAPSHRLMHETARLEPWRERLAPLITAPPVAEPGSYLAMLAPRVAALDIWETVYQQILSGPDAVKEYTKGSWLNRFLQALPAAEAAAFEADYAARLRAAYPPLADGRTVFPFRRQFIVARAA